MHDFGPIPPDPYDAVDIEFCESDDLEEAQLKCNLQAARQLCAIVSAYGGTLQDFDNAYARARKVIAEAFELVARRAAGRLH